MARIDPIVTHCDFWFVAINRQKSPVFRDRIPWRHFHKPANPVKFRDSDPGVDDRLSLDQGIFVAVPAGAA